MSRLLFSVSYARWDEGALEAGETDDRGMEAEGLTLGAAIDCAGGLASSASERSSVDASASDWSLARWVSCVDVEHESGDVVEATIHYPEWLTEASRARVTRAILARL